MNRKLTRFAINLTFCSVAVYLLAAFSAWSWDPGTWPVWARVIAVYATAMAAGVLTINAPKDPTP